MNDDNEIHQNDLINKIAVLEQLIDVQIVKENKLIQNNENLLKENKILIDKQNELIEENMKLKNKLIKIILKNDDNKEDLFYEISKNKKNNNIIINEKTNIVEAPIKYNGSTKSKKFCTDEEDTGSEEDEASIKYKGSTKSKKFCIDEEDAENTDAENTDAEELPNKGSARNKKNNYKNYTQDEETSDEDDIFDTRNKKIVNKLFELYVPELRALAEKYNIYGCKTTTKKKIVRKILNNKSDAQLKKILMIK
jgi:hypothetical protein